MPRVSGVYSRPAGIDAVAGAVIESADYNLNVADVENDLNVPRPIVAGGTGASTIDQALVNLQAEKNMQVVTNYDTQVFVGGSFLSNVGATGAPNAIHHFLGIAYVYDSANIFLEARDLEDTSTPAKCYVRRRLSGSWGPWILSDAAITAGFLPLTGGTLTGQLAQTGSAPTITLNTTTGAGASNQIEGLKNGARRWLFQLGDGQAETGGNTGSHFIFYGYDDGGTGWSALQVNRQTRKVTQYLNTDFIGNLAITGTVGITNATPSSSPASGALQVVGGLGVQGRIYSTYAFFANGGYFGTTNPMPPTDAGLNIGYAGGGSQYGLALRAGIDVTNAVLFYNAAGTLVGSISQTATNVAFNTTSDERLKHDLQPFDAGEVLDRTNVYDFAWIATGERAHGVIAQEAREVFPEAVTHDDRYDVYGVDYSKYVPLLLQEIKALRARVAALEGMGV